MFYKASERQLLSSNIIKKIDCMTLNRKNSERDWFTSSAFTHQLVEIELSICSKIGKNKG